MSHIVDRVGERYGRLTVLYRTSDTRYKNRSFVTWHCRCDCGNEVDVVASSLHGNLTNSCGCLNLEKMRSKEIKHHTHGEHGTRLYRCWRGMKQRCLNARDHNYVNYGKRGITVCKEWANSYEAFAMWARANGYNDSLSLDRIDVNGNYEPSNCRWATNIQQQRNKRNNSLITYNGKTLTQSEWSEITGLSRYAIHDRICELGWSIEKTLTTPRTR